MCQTCGWEAFVFEIQELLDDNRYRKSHDFLKSIQATVRRNRHATEKQAESVANVQERGW